MQSFPHYVRVAPGEPLPNISHLAPFKAVVALESPYSETWQKDVSDWLVASGCRYMMAWGPDCSSWDDSVDMADIEARDFKENDEKFVLTTWHDDETLESVFWYSQFCANFSYDDVELITAVVLHVSTDDRGPEFLALFEQSKTLPEREKDQT